MTSSSPMSDRPVMLPAGRARLWMRRVPTGSPAPAMMMGVVSVASRTARTAALPGRDDCIDPLGEQILGKRSEARIPTIGPVLNDLDVLSVQVTMGAKLSAKRLLSRSGEFAVEDPKNADARDARYRLRR